MMMTNPSILDQILEANKSFMAGAPKPLDDAGPFFLIITCIDPRLTGLLTPAMGLPRGRAMIIRIAGNSILPSSHDVQRSVAAAMYIRGAREIFVAGHTDCAMAAFSAQSVIENFRSAGVPRSAFGSGDLREWFGAYSDIKANVFQSIENLARSGILPSDAVLHGLIIDTVSGKVEVLKSTDFEKHTSTEQPRSTDVTEISSPPANAPVKASRSLPASHGEARTPIPTESKRHKGPASILGGMPSNQESASPPQSMAEALNILTDFFQKERQNPKLRPDLLLLREKLSKDASPLELLLDAARIARENAVRYPRVPGAIEYLASQLKSGNSGESRIGSILSQILRY